MSAEVLREAAALMRERAEAATRGRWQHDHVGLQAGEQIHNGDIRVARVYANEADWRACENAEHIASWHPAVALAVADWLEIEAEWVGVEDPSTAAPALAVARAYLGNPT